MVKSLSILVFFMTSIIVNAQKNADAIYLKNGSIIRGTIITPKDTTKTGIELKDHSFLVFDNEEVEATKKNVYGAKPNGFSMKLNSCLYGGSQLSSGTKIQGGYKFKDRFYIGLGSGIEGFNERYIPLFLEAEFNLSTAATQPYIYIYGGYNFYSGNAGNYRNSYYYDQWGNGYYVERDYNGGSLLGLGIGMNKHFSPNFGMGFQLGYRFQRTSVSLPNVYWVSTSDWGNGYYEENGSITIINDYHRFELGIFLLF